ncbi:MAG: response regulator transcription factor [Sphingobacteriales bacterium]|nr:MAG: response regulator transcription factor [Sphingobacteriales bacterium]
MVYRIAIVEDVPRALRSLMNDFNHFREVEVVLTAANGDDFLAQLKQLPTKNHPQVVLMDLDMPIINGIDAIKISSQLYTDLQYIMLTVVEDSDKLFEAIKAGAHGYLLKEESIQVIVSAIKEVVDKVGSPMSPRIARKTLQLLSQDRTATPNEPTYATLTTREIEILKLLGAGKENKEIADQLFISPNTVRNHIVNIYEKLHITSRSQAVKVAIKNNWV